MLSNTNITEIKEITSPNDLLSKYSPIESDISFICDSRKVIENILNNKDTRLMVIVGPCSIHDYDTAIHYAKHLQGIQQSLENIYIVMRVYFEKPRSRVGWKGFIYDPDLDNSFKINKGLDLARKLLLEITKMKIPIGCEFLDTITPQYLSDLVSWGAIGARTSESQIHRQLASGLSMPIGFKNLTSGDYEKAIDGIISSTFPHNFLAIDNKGIASHVITKGNKNSHLILRGGDEPNYEQSIIENITKALEKENIQTGIIIDCSHGNSQKDYNRQLLVALYVKRLRLLNKYPIRGIMLESNINKGNQKISFPTSSMKKGVSVTDACMDIDTTNYLLKLMDDQIINNNINTLPEIRLIIRSYDETISSILKGNILFMNKLVLLNKPIVIENDKEIADICRSKPNEEILLMMVNMRLALSEKVSEIKLNENPFEYLNKHNDFLRLITKREVEKEILRLFEDPIYLKIMEISKNIQVMYLEKATNDIKIGYLFGKGTFSHEVITNNLRGTHISYPNFIALKAALLSKDIDYMIIPTYNSIIGEILNIDTIHKVRGVIDHKIELSLYSNKLITTKKKEIDVLYVEQHILKEASKYIEKNLIIKDKVIVKNSVEGCIMCIKDINKVSMTISSKNNDSSFLHKLDDNLVDHNITTFSLISL
jgi:3-deoxy-7-phosphoheptulonate synthase